MEAVHKYMVMDSKTYKPAVCRENGHQLEQEEIGDTYTMVIRTENYIIEIEIGQE
jgi:hypothetical protein